VVDRDKARVVIAEDHPAVRKGVRRLLERLPQVEVVGEAKNGREALEIVAETRPDVLILDIQMPVMDGIEVIEKLHETGADILILVLSAIEDPLFVREILALGACRFILKGDIPDLIEAIQQLNQGLCQDEEGFAAGRMRVRVY
jgi:two-component system, NarL family, nitrate/nitrite response regulator NarL